MAVSPAAAKDDVALEPMLGFVPSDGAPICRGTAGYADDFGGRRTFLWRPSWVGALAANPAAYAQAVADGEKALKNGPYSVTDKPKLVPGATPNDYASIGPYWWPDPKKKDGLPYIRRDGDVNPERSGPEFDKTRLSALGDDMRALSLAYAMNGDERYARHGAKLLRAWFIDPATRMNPNLNFAQGIPGKVTGRGFGIIDSSDLSTIVESIGLLRPSAAMSDAEHAHIEQWYRDFAVWLATSENGAQEMATVNNHGVFYDFYLAHFALYAGLDGVTRNIVEAFPASRLAVQMDRRGRFMKELERTRSWHYSHFVVEGSAKLATIGECVDRDLWSYKLPDGRGLETAEAFLAKYWDGSAGKWPFPDKDLPDTAEAPTTSKYRSRLSLLLGRGASVDGSYVPE